MIRLAVRVRRAQAELVLAELIELAPAGVEEREGQGDTVEYAIYGAPGELPQLPDLQAAAGGALVDVSTSEIADDWHERWRAFHSAVVIAAPAGAELAGVRVRPPWEPPANTLGESPANPLGEPPAPPTEPARALASGGDADSPRAGLLEVVIDPGQAFGTGAHATTRLCLELLLELAGELPPPRPPLIDVGAGSGVLAIVAAGLGFAPALALDNDPLSVQAARENAAANGTSVETRRFDLRTEPLPALGDGDAVVVANLLGPLLLQLCAALPSAPAHLIAGGLLREEADGLAAAFASAHGMRRRARRECAEWAALWLQAAG